MYDMGGEKKKKGKKKKGKIGLTRHFTGRGNSNEATSNVLSGLSIVPVLSVMYCTRVLYSSR